MYPHSFSVKSLYLHVYQQLIAVQHDLQVQGALVNAAQLFNVIAARWRVFHLQGTQPFIFQNSLTNINNLGQFLTWCAAGTGNYLPTVGARHPH